MQWNVAPADWAELLAALPRALPRALRSDAEWLRACLPRGAERASTDGSGGGGDDDTLEARFTLGTHWRMLLVGEPGAGMFNHQDTLRTASWQAQLRGAKRWHLCAPDQSAFLGGGAGEVDALGAEAGGFVDYGATPALRNASCALADVRAGDVLWYPHDWWHQTRVLSRAEAEAAAADTATATCDTAAGEADAEDELSVSLSATLVTPRNAEFLEAELTRECAGDTRSFYLADEAICAQLRECYAWWRRVYPARAARDMWLEPEANSSGSV